MMPLLRPELEGAGTVVRARPPAQRTALRAGWTARERCRKALVLCCYRDDGASLLQRCFGSPAAAPKHPRLSERRRRRLLRPWDGAHSCAVSPGVSEGSGRYGWRGRRWWGRELGAVSAPQRPICHSLASSLRCCASGGFCGGILPASQRATCTRAASSTRRFALPLELVAGHGPGYAALETNSLAIHRTVLSSTRVCTSSPSTTRWQRMLTSAKKAAIFGGIVDRTARCAWRGQGRWRRRVEGQRTQGPRSRQSSSTRLTGRCSRAPPAAATPQACARRASSRGPSSCSRQ